MLFALTAVPVLAGAFVAASAFLATGGGLASAQDADAGMSDVSSWSSVPCPGAVPTDSPYLGMDGRVQTCLRVPDVPAGLYGVFFENYLLAAPPATTPTTPGGTVAAPAVHLVVTPAEAEPGQVVTFTGTLARAYKGTEDYLDLCWDGCPDGLQYSGVPVTWRNRTTFTGHLTLPAAPWLQRGGHLGSPVAGRYELGVQCVLTTKGCAGGPAEGEAPVTLTSSARYTCATYRGCTQLEIAPGTSSPGDVVELTGYAPLQDVIGSDGAFGLSLTEARGAVPSGVTVGAGPGGPVEIGNAAVRVTAAPTFASLGTRAALSVTQVGSALISSNPASPGTVVSCGNDDIWVTGPTGTTTEVPTSAAVSLLKSDPQFQSYGPDECQGVAVGPPPGGAAGGAGTGTIYAAFGVQPTQSGEPAFAEVGMYTTDGGTTWSYLPVPLGASQTTFGGYRYAANGQVEALFALAVGATPEQVPLVEEASASAPGGFAAAPFSCPSAGPCVSLGAYPMPVNCAMGDAGEQPVLSSPDGGQTWAPLSSFVAGLPTCWPAGAVAYSATDELLYSSQAMIGAIKEIPALYTTDGGAEWQVVSLPPLPPASPNAQGAQQPSLEALPTGGFLDLGAGNLLLLPPGGSRWCTVAEAPTLATALKEALPASFTVIGGDVWFLISAATNGDLTPTGSYSVAASALACK